VGDAQYRVSTLKKDPMNYQNTLEFAKEMDVLDPLKDFRSKFLVPKYNGKDAIYLCGNSLGLQPVSAQQNVNAIFDTWKDLAIEGFFKGDNPWLGLHKRLTHTLSSILGKFL
jgi:kynureninase